MNLSNWNRIPKVKNVDFKLYQESYLNNPTIPRGYGNTYGDASLYSNVTSMTSLKNVCTIEGKTLHISSGYNLQEALTFVTKHNLIIPVFPGTQYVSIGGMIAADVHGKNHNNKGTIGNWIESITIKIGSGEIIECNRTKEVKLFEATIGGMGLTGIIISVRIKLEPLIGTKIIQNTTEYQSIEDLLEGLIHSKSSHKIAWINLLNHSDQGFMLEGDFIKEKETTSLFTKSKLTMPNLGFPILNRPIIKLYNKKYARNLRKNKSSIVNFSDYFFPLDKIQKWNNAYGLKGFYQYQFVLPLESKNGIQKIIKKIQSSPYTPYLVSLKQFGGVKSPGLLSFPCKGFSLAIDFKNTKGITTFIKELDKIVCAENGRIYLAKDCLLDETTFNKMYKNVDLFKSGIEKVNHGSFVSLLAKRLNLLNK